jgi:hypothetical protein
VRADFKVIENLFHSKSNQNVIKAAEKSLDVQNLPSASTMSTEGVMHDFRFTVHACIDGSEGVRDNPQSIMTFLNDCRHQQFLGLNLTVLLTTHLSSRLRSLESHHRRLSPSARRKLYAPIGCPYSTKCFTSRLRTLRTDHDL